MKSPRDLVIRLAHDRRLPAGKRRAFTLIELLVVILIILLVSAVALPTVLPAIAHRQVSEAARIVQGALAGARDAAIHNNSLSGIRLLPDPAFPLQYNTVNGQISATNILAANRFIPIQPGPNYSEGLINITSPSYDQANKTGPLVPYPLAPPGNYYPYPPVPGSGGGNVLMIEQSVYDPHSGPSAVLNPPTSWFWNIRVGDKIQVNTSGDLYTVVGPMVVAPWNGNPEMFVNLGLPGAAIPSTYYPTRTFLPPGATQAFTYQQEDYLFVVNGQDDNGNGLVDEGWNGIDDNLVNGPDDLAEWEPETWLGSIGNTLSTLTWTAAGPVFGRIQNQSYTIIRRPVPSPNARETALPSNVVIDLTSVLLDQERSRFPVGTIDPYTGHVDIVLTPRGDVVPTTIYSSPASVGLTGAFYHFWLAERGDLFAVQTYSNYPFNLPMPLGSNYTFAGAPANAYDLLVAQNPLLPWLKGEQRLVTLYTRTGQVIMTDEPTFDVNNVSRPYIAPEQGVRGGQ